MCLTCFRDHVYRLLEIVLSFAVLIFVLLPIVLKIAVSFYVWPFLVFCFYLSSFFLLSNDWIPLLACVFQIDVWMSAKGGVGWGTETHWKPIPIVNHRGFTIGVGFHCASVPSPTPPFGSIQKSIWNREASKGCVWHVLETISTDCWKSLCISLYSYYQFLCFVLKISVCLYVWPFLFFCFSLSSLFFLSDDRIPLLACVFQIDVWMSAKGGVGWRTETHWKPIPIVNPLRGYNFG